MQLWLEKLMDFIGALENALGKTAEFSLSTRLSQGVERFVNWYVDFYKVPCP